VLPTVVAGGSRPPPPPRARPRPPVLRTHAVVGLRGRASPCLRGEGRPPPCHARTQLPAAVHARSLRVLLTDAAGSELSDPSACVPAGGLNGKGSVVRTLACRLLRSPSLARGGPLCPKKRNFRGRAARPSAHLPERCLNKRRLATHHTLSVPRRYPSGPPTRPHAVTTAVRPATRGGGAPHSRPVPPVGRGHAYGPLRGPPACPRTSGRATGRTPAAPRHAPSGNFRSPLAVRPPLTDGTLRASGLQTQLPMGAGGVYSCWPLA
jgi:hypothetical protein